MKLSNFLILIFIIIVGYLIDVRENKNVRLAVVCQGIVEGYRTSGF